MRTLRQALILALSFGCSLLFASSVLAQRAFVSAATGSDANSCTRDLPCRTIAAAISNVAAGGEVVVLDSGGYGTFTASKAVSVEAPAGVYAGVTATSGDGIVVSAGATDIVVLRGLTIYGSSGVQNGINFTSGGALYVENCVINGFGGLPVGAGIIHQPAGQPGVITGNLFLSDTVVRNCGTGVWSIGAASGARITTEHCRLENNVGAGFLCGIGCFAYARDTISSGNSVGFGEQGGLAGPAVLYIDHCVAANNLYYGIGASGSAPLSPPGGRVRVTSTTVYGAQYGVINFGSDLFESSGNNFVFVFDGQQTQGTITIVPSGF
jgi:hypothetical protein